jgi:hypothetical protein
VRLRRVTTKYVFDVTDEPVMRDAKRRKFQAEDVIITHRTGQGFWEIRVHGYTTTASPWSTAVIWSIRDDRIQSNNIGRPPRWMHDLLAHAVTLHASRKPEAQPQGQATGYDLCTCHGSFIRAHARTTFCPEVTG